MIDVQFLLKVLVASFATVGLMETAKKFWKTEKKVWYAVAMVTLSIGSYFSVEVLPMWIIGGLLTIGCVQISYQTIVQGFKIIIKNLARRIGSGYKGAENV